MKDDFDYKKAYLTLIGEILKDDEDEYCNPAGYADTIRQMEFSPEYRIPPEKRYIFTMPETL